MSLARTTARSFAIETDEPAPLGGTDKAIDPMELLLAAVGTCLQIGWVTHANRRGIDFRSLRIETKGDYDLQGYMALDPKLPPGFLNISYAVEVDTDADPAVLEEIRIAAERWLPGHRRTCSRARPSTPRSRSSEPGSGPCLRRPQADVVTGHTRLPPNVAGSERYRTGSRTNR